MFFGRILYHVCLSIMKKSYYSILIIHDKADKLSRHKISNIVLYAAAVFAFAVLVASVSMLYNYLNIRLEMLELFFPQGRKPDAE